MSEGKKEIINGNCFDVLKTIEDASIDLILTDPPYNTTDCKWDKQPIDWNELKSEFLRVIKPTGTICISVQNPFGFLVGGLFAEIYRHRWVWEKDKCGNFLAAKASPLKYTEDILVFQKNGYYKAWNNNGNPKGIYNPQMRKGTGKAKKTNSERFGLSSTQISDRPKYNPLIANPETDGIVRYPADIIYFSVPHRKDERFHPTQKPIELFEYLIKTYTNEGDLVLDNCAGSGTTAIACLKTNRQFIVMEKEQKYYDIILKRVGDFNKKFETQTLFGNEM